MKIILEIKQLNYKNMTKLNENTVRKLEEAFSVGSDVSAACYYADISRECFYRWIKEGKMSKEKYDRLREKPVLKAYQTIYKELDKADTAKWYLERKRKDEFSSRQEHSGRDGEPIAINISEDIAKKNGLIN